MEVGEIGANNNQGGFNQIAILAKSLKDTFADQPLGGGKTLYGVLDEIIAATRFVKGATNS